MKATRSLRATRSRVAIGLVTVALVAAPATSAAAEPGEATHVDSLVASVSGGVVTVSGEASFVDVPLLVAEDSAGDSLGANIGAPLGDDLTTATIARQSPFEDTVTFSVGVANQPPTLSGTPEVLVYNWEFVVSTEGDEPSAYQLRAQRTAQVGSPGVNPYFVLSKCSDGVPRSCPPLATVPGRMQEGVVEWDVPFDLITAQAGSLIENVGAIEIWLSASGLASTGVVRPDRAFFDEEFYTVPGPTVRFGVAPVGTSPEFVDLTASGTVQNSGAFTGALPAPAEPGAYTVVVEACQGPASCALAATDITV